jgi:hypothetical protein
VGADGERDLIRASDEERTVVADRLRAALDEGRLTVAEYDERLRLAYAAVTYGDLLPLTTDLPAAPKPAPPAPPAPSLAARLMPVRAWLAGNLIFIVIWGVSSLASHQLQFFWPAFILLFTGLGPVRRALRGNPKG